MATAQQFEDLGVWQDARKLVKEIYTASKQRSFYRDFGLRDQIRRAATSTMSNIAEGFERGTRREFVQFLNIAKGSNGEVRSQIYVALDQEYLTEKGLTHSANPPFRFPVGSRVSFVTWKPIPTTPASENPRDVESKNLQPSTFNLQLLTRT